MSDKDKGKEGETAKALRKGVKGRAAEVQPSGRVKPGLKKILDEGKKGEEGKK